MWAAAALSNPSIVSLMASESPPLDLKDNPRYSLGIGEGFPTERRPKQRVLSTEALVIMWEWFEESGITIGSMAKTEDERNRAVTLLYTWKDCFASSVKDI